MEANFYWTRTMLPADTEKIEILPVQLLDENRALVNELKGLARSLGLGFGWHYLLDLCWIITNLGDVRNQRIMDAGAGVGILQWYLASHGAEVLSVDRGSRANLPLRFRRRFQVSSFHASDQPLAPGLRTLADNLGSSAGIAAKLGYLKRELVDSWAVHPVEGRVIVFDHDLGDLHSLESGSLDAVVSLSALEHNPPENLKKVIDELTRVVKPGGRLLATLGASKQQDWFHQASLGWCYTEASLREFFDLPASAPSNYDCYDELFAALYDCAELRDNLGKFYFRSGNNGMPWGKWDPKYQSAGVLKLKRA
jgi:SAM-dependent methyltransferase